VVSRFQLLGRSDTLIHGYTNWCGAKHVSRAGSKRNKCKLLRSVMLNFFYVYHILVPEPLGTTSL